MAPTDAWSRTFIAQALKGQSRPTVMAAKHCHCATSTGMIDGVMSLMHRPSDFADPGHLGYPAEFTIREFAELVIDITESRSKLAYLPLPRENLKRRQPEIALARASSRRR